MIRDPLYRDILQRLAEQLDPNAFERAVADLLPPTLGLAIPVPGGSDAGFDAALVDGEGEPYPAVCTTGKDVLGNLRRSLTANLAAGFPRRRAVLATSQELSNQRKKNLFKAARKLDFELMGIFDREPLAKLLYQHPKVRLELLALGGDPLALAAVPAPGRYQLQTKLLARDEDLEWLRSTSGDRILVGVPGAGKTALAAALIDHDGALFVRPNASLGAILDACRKQRPALLVVDDAHIHLDLLRNLRTARKDSTIEFAILATTWPGQLLEVADALGLDPRQRHAVRTLELLTRAEILELYREMDVQGPDEYIRELIDQAANRPGLAVTLATLWKQGAWEEIFRGTALSAFASRTVRQLAGQGIEVLAALALGGRAGGSLQGVSDAFSMPIVETRRIIVNLGAAGVIAERGAGAFAVEPEQLRSALLADVFFSGKPDRLDFGLMFDRVESVSTAVEAIMSCLARGGKLPTSEARLLLAQGGARAWALYAHLGREQALWVLENYPGESVDIVIPVLDFAPEEGLARLFKEAYPPPENLGSTPGHPLRIIRDWVRDFTANQPASAVTADQIRKRDALTAAVLRYSEGGGRSEVVGPALTAVLDPVLESWSSGPENRLAMTMRCCIAPVEVIEQLTGLWSRLRATVVALDRSLWSSLRELLWTLVQPLVPAGGQVSDVQRRATRALAEQIVLDILPVAKSRPGLERALRGFAAELELAVDVIRDPTYDLLYPEDPAHEPDFDCWSTAQSEAMTRLAEDWKDEKPDTAAGRWLRYRREAEVADHRWPDNNSLLATKLATRVQSPEAWLEAFSDAGLGSVLGAPFLAVIVRCALPGWEKRLAEALESDDLAAAALELSLTIPDLSETLRLAAIARTAPFAATVETWALRGEIPTAVIELVLSEGAPEVALAVAVGHWLADSRGAVESALAAVWRRVILGARGRAADGHQIEGNLGYWLGEILSGDPDLALAWLQAEIDAAPPTGSFLLLDSEPASCAAKALGPEQRHELLAAAPFGGFDSRLIGLLVGDDPGLFEVLLAREGLQSLHLAPLGRIPDSSWWTLAEIAVKIGIAPSDLAHASLFLDQDGWHGSEAEHRKKWVSAFASPPEAATRGLTEVARIGHEIATRLVAEAGRNERQEAMRGGY
jgi:hypothetical protein